MAKYLVTGGAGFIGSTIVDELVARGESVRVLDNFSTGHKENLNAVADKVEVIKGDICNIDDVKKAVKGIDYVINQAAYISVPGSIKDPAMTNKINIDGTLNMLLESRAAGVKRFVTASSCAVYGSIKTFPLTEDMNPDPLSPYAISKVVNEYYCKTFNSLYGLETVALRYFNVYGPKQRADSAYAAVIPLFISRLAKGEPCMIEGDGLQSRDFIFVKDIANANITACTAQGAAGGVYNVARGRETTVKQLADGIRKVMNKNIEHVHVAARVGDIRKSFGDNSKLKKVFGIEPHVDLDEGLKKTVEWFLKI
ncbi:MAG: SDR family oxidoreductase [Candidatus Omnitrophica bacterium]|nr:SDR family oxidoreductase [Candidatus Omnitrophota bacterium]